MKIALKQSCTYILVSHGSREAQSQLGLCLLVKKIRQELECQNDEQKILIETASLELGETDLAQQIEKIGQKAISESIGYLKILPLFLMPGFHVQEDIPKEIAQAAEKLGDSIDLELLPYLGSYQGLTKLLEKRFQQLYDREETGHIQRKRILVAHGTTRGSGNQPCEALAHQLGAQIAYWSIEPHLETIVGQMIVPQVTSIDIVPYFIFEGGITKSLKQQVETLQTTYPQIQFTLSPPLSPTKELALLIVEGILK